MLKKVAFTMYPVTDVARARSFYEGTLGLAPGSVGNQGEGWWIEYDLPGGGCLALTNFTGDKPSDTAGGTIAFEVEDLDRLMADLKGKGVRSAAMIHSRCAGWRCASTRRATRSCCTSSRASEPTSPRRTQRLGHRQSVCWPVFDLRAR
jgi:extradiol dioxygenase family protein